MTIKHRIDTNEYHSWTLLASRFRIDAVKADVFSLGVSLHELIFDCTPFVDEREAASHDPVTLRVSVQSLRKLSDSNRH